ncbi:hypothetical protein P7K49_001067 [Saguinus oedipus]|uniref:Uncharacterized protein n=1 Tax=Saguinus oedipus TaxID=9490 RepID=A0ABQ9WDI7_SAGOE|nr:hypothetical protein P7K49_001067 [Saguinus oedipus]
MAKGTGVRERTRALPKVSQPAGCFLPEARGKAGARRWWKRHLAAEPRGGAGGLRLAGEGPRARDGVPESGQADFLGLQEPQEDRPGGDMEGSPIPVLTAPTVPYEDQRPAGGGGAAGQRNYLPNFIQSVLSSIDLRDRQDCTMVVGSDGRYFSKTATKIVVQMAAANGASE